MDVGLEVLELVRPSKRTDDVDVHAIFAPLVGGDAEEAAEASMRPKGPRAAQNQASCESAGKGCAEVAFVRAGFEDSDGRASRFMQTDMQPSGLTDSEYSLHF